MNEEYKKNCDLYLKNYKNKLNLMFKLERSCKYSTLLLPLYSTKIYTLYSTKIYTINKKAISTLPFLFLKML